MPTAPAQKWWISPTMAGTATAPETRTVPNLLPRGQVLDQPRCSSYRATFATCARTWTSRSRDGRLVRDHAGAGVGGEGAAHDSQRSRPSIQRQNHCADARQPAQWPVPRSRACSSYSSVQPLHREHPPAPRREPGPRVVDADGHVADDERNAPQHDEHLFKWRQKGTPAAE